MAKVLASFCIALLSVTSFGDSVLNEAGYASVFFPQGGGLSHHRRLQLQNLTPTTSTGQRHMSRTKQLDIFNDLEFQDLDLNLSDSKVDRIYLNSQFLAASPYYLTGIYVYSLVYHQAARVSHGKIPLHFSELEEVAFTTMLQHWRELDWGSIGGRNYHDYALDPAPQLREFAKKVDLSLSKWLQSYENLNQIELRRRILNRAQKLNIKLISLRDYLQDPNLSKDQLEAGKKLLEWLETTQF